jgi:hypothetical protein
MAQTSTLGILLFMLSLPRVKKFQPQIGKYAFILAICWTILVAASLAWNLWRSESIAMQGARLQARVAFQKDFFYRRWNSIHGGVYAPISPETPPNPYLKKQERTIKTASGQTLTKINPAYMTRQVHELQARDSGIRGHITSLKPIRPANAPDAWEKKALKAFEKGSREFSEIKPMNGELFYRLMRPLKTEKSCLSCHAEQGYSLGDVRGGISVSIPLEPIFRPLHQTQLAIAFTHGLLWVVVMVGLVMVSRKLNRQIKARIKAYQDREKAILASKEAQKDAKELKGLLPICARCKKIRDDQGYWNRLEEYISEHSEAEFSHGLCPKCAEDLYPDIVKSKKNKASQAAKPNSSPNKKKTDPV